jgi:hypothetical protein
VRCVFLSLDGSCVLFFVRWRKEVFGCVSVCALSARSERAAAALPCRGGADAPLSFAQPPVLRRAPSPAARAHRESRELPREPRAMPMIVTHTQGTAAANAKLCYERLFLSLHTTQLDRKQQPPRRRRSCSQRFRFHPTTTDTAACVINVYVYDSPLAIIIDC